MRQLSVLIDSINKRTWQKASYDASLHDKEINVPTSREDEPELNQDQEKLMDAALKRAMDRKRSEING